MQALIYLLIKIKILCYEWFSFIERFTSILLKCEKLLKNDKFLSVSKIFKIRLPMRGNSPGCERVLNSFRFTFTTSSVEQHGKIKRTIITRVCGTSTKKKRSNHPEVL